MAIELDRPDIGGLREALQVLRQWQHDDAPMQLHPGDLGWAWQYGAAAMAAALRSWRRNGQIVALAMLDSPAVLRLTTAPDVRRDEELARRIVADVTDPARGVLPAGKVAVEAPNGTLVQELLLDAGWNTDQPWTPLRRDLAEPVTAPDLRIEVVGAGQVPAYTAVHRSSFGSTRFTDDLWHTMATGLPYTDARSLLGYDEQGNAVAEVTVWSAGVGRPGLLEPMGVDADHHGHGYGRAICIAAAAALQQLGSSCALVCTPSVRVAAVATYRSAGFQVLPERLDRARGA